VFALETHVHADHVTGAWLLKRQLGSRIALSKDSGVEETDRYLGNFAGSMYERPSTGLGPEKSRAIGK